MWVDQFFPDAQNFKATRSLNQRQHHGMGSTNQFVTTHKTATGFGHGAHACPGRWFASSLLKIASIYILLKYEFRLDDDVRNFDRGFFSIVPDTKRISVRRREAEIDLDEIHFASGLKM